MHRVMSRKLLRFISAAFCLTFFAVNIFSQLDPDPNSPEPILLTLKDSPRALASSEKAILDPRRPPKSVDDFESGSRVVLYAMNFDFLPGEGSNSLRVYAADENGHQFRFPVIDAAPGALLAGNLLDAPYTEAKVGRRVEVTFQPLNEDFTLPQFRLAQ